LAYDRNSALALRTLRFVYMAPPNGFFNSNFGAGFLKRIHFAGEHTCYAFTGYMEAALQSGIRVAEQIARRDGILGRKRRPRSRRVHSTRNVPSLPNVATPSPS
jgi:Flavin containing amine oxidoreductase